MVSKMVSLHVQYSLADFEVKTPFSFTINKYSNIIPTGFSGHVISKQTSKQKQNGAVH